ncbi:hypothetical protein [Paenibacillus etheri]|uniref:hypothetical protein n=1 Tax=Paenibacillus etheri TaxID=1306852 RepID=UPI0012E3E7EF|nr:hypothetical protein [Paenibacillus etheri]
MEWRTVFKLYNTRKQKSNLLLYLFVMLSVVIAVSISLAIPQIISETEHFLTGQVEELNGADLKVEATYASSAYDRKLDELKTDGLQISKQSAFSTTFKHDESEILGSLIIGDFGLQEDEIILFAPLAEELNIKQADQVSIGNQTYTVKDIESTSRAVDGQSEMIGYGKVSFYPLTNEMPNNFITLINGDRIDEVKSELKTIEPGYTYSTIEDKKQEIQTELNTNATTLNILNTMSYIMTILSVLSGIFMIIVQRQQDIAIMRLLSIRMKSIKKALRMELYLVFIIPVLLGSIASIPLARQLLVRSGIHNTEYDSSLIGRVLAGFLLFLLIYFIFINIATKALEAIHPLFVIRGDNISWKASKRKVTWLSVLFALLTLVVYAVYLGRGSALLSSIVIVAYIGFFFVITLWCIKLLSSLPLKNKLVHYTAKNIKANRYAFVITVLSLTLTSLFLLVGYTLEKTVRDSYTAGVEQKLNYNYLAVSDDPAKLENALKESAEVDGYTKLYRQSGTLLTAQGSSKSAQICSINEDDYHIKYKILEGEDVFQGSADDVLISSAFSEQIEVKVGGTLKLELDGATKNYRVKGIYEAGQVNPAFILKPAVNESKGSLLFLVKADSSSFKENVSGVSLMHISIMGMAIMKRMADFLTIFKWLCWICIFSSVLFNLNLIYMNYLNEYKDSVIIRALGVGKGFLYKHLGLKSVYAMLLSLLMSLGLYIAVLSLALEVIFKVNVNIAAETIVIPVSCALGIVAVIFFIPFRLLQRAQGFEELREQV